MKLIITIAFLLIASPAFAANAIIVNPDGMIINRIVYNMPDEAWLIAEVASVGLTMIPEQEGTPWAIGGTYINGVYTPPPQPPPLPGQVK